jgi:selenocysteine lyase/cysteine desulfurase
MFSLAPKSAKGEVQGLPDETLFQRDPEAYWRRIREEQFLLPGWRAFLNNGSLGVAPRPVVRAVEEYLNNAAALVSDEYPRWGYETLDAHRLEIADFFGCKKDELALVHNATEAMSTIAAGMDLKAGDEVVLTDQEHPSGRSCWQVRAKRHGVTLREVKIPLPPKDPGQVADVLISAIGPRTRVLSFSGITTTTGLIAPVREVCAAARAKGVITVVDGAHMNGQIPFRFQDLGCDFFAGSPHKWLFAPAGCGLLYVREEMLDRHWPTIVTGGWDNRDLKAAKYMMVGTNNRAIFEGLIAGLRFLKAIGPERVYGRIHQLARMAFAKARSVEYLDLLTPDDDRMFGSLVTFQFKGRKLDRLWELCNTRRIWVVRAERLRISTHIHTRPTDLDLFFNTMREALG